jgi:hypothetical protein
VHNVLALGEEADLSSKYFFETQYSFLEYSFFILRIRLFCQTFVSGSTCSTIAKSI